MSSTILKGVVHGNRIDLEREAGLPDGQEVRVTVEPLSAPTSTYTPGDGIRLSAGAWAEDAAELDEFLAWQRQHRRQGRKA